MFIDETDLSWNIHAGVYYQMRSQTYHDLANYYRRIGLKSQSEESQDDAAYFAPQARVCLLSILGSDPEERG